MATINVKDAAGATVPLEKPLTPGRASEASSRPVVLSNEDKAVLGSVDDPSISDPAQSGSLIALVKGLLSKILPPVTPTQASVVASASAVTLLAANTNRKPGSIIVNDSVAILYIKLGSGASSSDYWAALDGKTSVAGIASIPAGYLGIITGIWASATGAARVTEMA